MYIPISKNFTIKVCGRKKSPLFLYYTIIIYEKNLCTLMKFIKVEITGNLMYLWKGFVRFDYLVYLIIYTANITTFIIMTLSIKSFYLTLSLTKLFIMMNVAFYLLLCLVSLC